MRFLPRVTAIVVLCAALSMLACASDAGDQEATEVAEKTESVSVEPVELEKAPDETQAAEAEKRSTQPADTDRGYTRAKDAAFDFTLKGIDGSYIRLSDYTGKVVLLNFWDTWCAPCRMEIPDLKEFHHKYAGDGFAVIGVALGRQGEQKVKTFVDQSGIDYPVVMASDEMIRAYGGVASIPITFLLGRDQTIHKRYFGLQRKQVLESEIRDLLAQG